MLEKIDRLLEKTNNISRSTYFWNAANAMILAMQSPVVLAVATRTNGEADAGIFSIALAEANLMYFLASTDSGDISLRTSIRISNSANII